MKTYSRLTFLISFLLIMIATSFKLQDLPSRVKEKWIPEDFNPKNTVLLIEEHPYGAKQNRRLSEYLQEHYPYKYELVSMAQITDSATYKDTKAYPFALLWSEFMTGHANSGIVYKDTDGHFLDRTNDNHYPKSRLGIGFGQVGYRKVINAIAKKFKDPE